MNSDKLKALLDKYDNAYYDNDAPIISDEEYNALKKKYLKLINQEEYDYVPGQANFESMKHTYPVKSLGKIDITDQNKLRSEIQRLWPIVIEPKYDGLTLVIYNEDKILTRGDGLQGDNMAENAYGVRGIPVDTFGCIVRGELMLNKKDFDDINIEKEAAGEPAFKNARNAAVGILRKGVKKYIEKLTFYAYNELGSSKKETVQLRSLNALGYNITKYYIPESIDDAVNVISNYDRNVLDFDIDGIVIKSNLENSLEIFGETEHHPKSAIAVKFEPQGDWTTLKSVEWHTGMTGKVAPVAIFEPIEIMGSEVSRATLHNIAYIEALGITKCGCRVKVVKAHDVIPAIIDTQPEDADGEDIVAPTECPKCHSKLQRKNDQLFCPNEDCPSRVVKKIAHMASKDALDIEGLSDETAQKIYNQFIEHGYNDINQSMVLGLNYDDILMLPGFAVKLSEKLYNNIQKAKRTTLDRIIYAAGIPNVGKKTAKDIAKHFKTIEAFVKDADNDFTELKTIPDIGEVTISSLKKYFIYFVDIAGYCELKEEETISMSTPEKQLTFVITGTLTYPRVYYENMIEDAGHKVSSAVSKKTDYVVAGYKPGSKYNKAVALNIKIIDEKQLIDILSNKQD